MTETHPISEAELSAYFDKELGPNDMRAIEVRLEHDPKARETLAQWELQSSHLQALYAQGAGPDETIPEHMLAQINGHLDERPRPPLTRWAAMLALVALGALGGWMSAQLTTGTGATGINQLASHAMDAHQTFVVEVAHPVEVEARQAEHLTGWISKRLGQDIAPPNFAAQGFQLMGGRILPGETGPAALFMYENTVGQRVTLYVTTPDRPGETAFQFAERGGVQSFYWMDRDLNYAVVGALPRDRLRAIAVAAYDQLI